ncbi:hypothetical protein D3C75_765210 [compost metagenome]
MNDVIKLLILNLFKHARDDHIRRKQKPVDPLLGSLSSAGNKGLDEILPVKCQYGRPRLLHTLPECLYAYVHNLLAPGNKLLHHSQGRVDMPLGTAVDK